SLCSFILEHSSIHPDLASFPTRRSSDLLLDMTADPEYQTCRQQADREQNAPGDRLGQKRVERRIDEAIAWRDLFALGLLPAGLRSGEHTSELQSRRDLVCRLLLEKNNIG